MKRHVKVVFDRRKTASKKGTGFIDICVYLKAGERKFETVGTATSDNWEAAIHDQQIKAKVIHYEQIINAMQLLGEEMIIANFNKHVCLARATSSVNEDNRHMFKGNDLRQSFIEYMESYLEKEDLRAGTRRNIVVVIDSLKESKILNPTLTL